MGYLKRSTNAQFCALPAIHSALPFMLVSLGEVVGELLLQLARRFGYLTGTDVPKLVQWAD